MGMTLKQRQQAVARAVKRLDAAADVLLDLQLMASMYGVDSAREENFASELRERASYWESCSWWRKDPT